MRRLLLLILILTTSHTSGAQNTLKEIMQNSHRLVVYPKGYKPGMGDINVTLGTGFVIRVKGRFYLVTAKHLFRNFKSGDVTTITIVNDNDSIIGSPLVYFLNNGKFPDIAVMPYTPTNNFYDLNQNVTSFDIGDDVIYAGFPETEYGPNHNRIFTSAGGGQTLPLIRKGYISGFDERNQDNKMIIIDSQTMPGFSGAPVYRYDTVQKKLGLLGVLSASFLTNVKPYNPATQYHTTDSNTVVESSLSILTNSEYIYQIISLIPNR